MKLGLGTVQFGLDYGISNAGGRTRPAAVRDILARAEQAGVDLLDTAPAYGAAESLLGELAPASSPFRIVTRTPLGSTAAGPGHLREGLLGSLERLGRSSVAGLLVHDREDLAGHGGAALFRELEALRTEGLTQRIGASLYHPQEAEALLERFPLDILQLPLSVLDQRALRSGLLERLASRGVQVHVRSLFLQGLLLMQPNALPHGLREARPALEAFRARSRELGLTPLQAALGFVESLPQVDVMVVGVNDRQQLEALLDGLGRDVDATLVADLAVENLDILDPSRWSPSR